MNSPRICIDARFYRRRTAGLGRYTRPLLWALLQQHAPYDVTVLLTPADKKEWKEDVKDVPANWQIKVLDIPHFSITEQTELLKYLNAEKFDLVHFLHFNHPTRYKGRFVTTIHDLNFFYYPPKPVWHPAMFAFRHAMKHAVTASQLLITDCEYTCDDIVKYYPIKRDKCVPILLAIEPRTRPEPSEKRREELRQKYAITKPFLFFVNSWRPHKGLPELLDAFLKIKPEHDVQILVAGKPVPQFPQVITAVDTAKKQSVDILTPGFISDEDMLDLYTMAAAYINPSHFEGFGLGPLDAMTYGAPVITAKNTSIPEVVGDAGLYYGTGNASDLAERITTLLNDSKLAEELRAKGLKQAKKFSFEKMATETLAVYHRVLSQG